MRDTVDEMLKIEVMHFELYISYHNIGSMKLLGSNHMPVSTIQPGLHKKKKKIYLVIQNICHLDIATSV